MATKITKADLKQMIKEQLQKEGMFDFLKSNLKIDKPTGVFSQRYGIESPESKYGEKEDVGIKTVVTPSKGSKPNKSISPQYGNLYPEKYGEKENIYTKDFVLGKLG